MAWQLQFVTLLLPLDDVPISPVFLSSTLCSYLPLAFSQFFSVLLSFFVFESIFTV